MIREQERGFTLIELLVVVSLLSIVLIAMYQVLFSGVRSTDTTRVLVDVSEEARAGFNRMVRDTREAERITAVADDGSSFTVEIDFDGDEVTDVEETFTWDAGTETVTLRDESAPAGETEVLMDGVVPPAGVPAFSFSSNDLEWDTITNDGISDLDEISAGLADEGDGIDSDELFYITNVTFNLVVTSEDADIVRDSDFVAEAQLRNSRGIVD